MRKFIIFSFCLFMAASTTSAATITMTTNPINPVVWQPTTFNFHVTLTDPTRPTSDFGSYGHVILYILYNNQIVQEPHYVDVQANGDFTSRLIFIPQKEGTYTMNVHFRPEWPGENVNSEFNFYVGNDNSIPKFPSVGLTLTAIFGLMLVVGRKKKSIE